MFQEGGLFGDWLYDHSIGLLGKPWKSFWGRGFPFLPMWTPAATTMFGVFATYVLTGKRWSHRSGDELRASGEALGAPASSPASGGPSQTAGGTPALPVAKPVSEVAKLLWLVGLGFGCLLVSWLWSLHLPIVKNRRTSTFALWCGGLSYLRLALFWWVVDVKNWRRGLGLWTAIGSNSILAYIMACLLMGGYGEIAWVFLGNLKPHLGDTPAQITAEAKQARQFVEGLVS